MVIGIFSMIQNGPSVTLFPNETLEKVNYYYNDFWDDVGDPRIKNYPLMSGGPWHIFTIIASYIYFVKVLGPTMMKNRPPMEIKSIILAYNIFMVFSNAYFFYFTAKNTDFGIKTWQCIAIDTNRADEEFKYKIFISYLYILSKFVDLLDTIFFVLRKNFHQVTTLHLVHHATVPIICWFFLKYSVSESSAFFPFINSFIHTIMYTYYALSALGPRIRPYLWWKKYLTQLQIIQLLLISVHCVYLGLNKDCNLPRILFIIGCPQALLFCFMFCKFFVKAYLKSGKSEKSGKAENLEKAENSEKSEKSGNETLEDLKSKKLEEKVSEDSGFFDESSIDEQNEHSPIPSSEPLHSHRD